MSFPCYFCERETYLSDEMAVSAADDALVMDRYYKCKSCYAMYEYRGDQKRVTDYHFSFRYDDMAHRVDFSIDPDNYCAIFRSGEKIPLISFDFIPNLTPQNIQTRIQTLLVFR